MRWRPGAACGRPSRSLAHVVHPAQQPLQHIAVHRHRTPRHRGVDQHAHEFGVLERVQLLSPKPIALQRRGCPLRRSCSACAMTAWLSGCGADMMASAQAPWPGCWRPRRSPDPAAGAPGAAAGTVLPARHRSGADMRRRHAARPPGRRPAGRHRSRRRVGARRTAHAARSAPHTRTEAMRTAGAPRRRTDAAFAGFDLPGHVGFLGDLARELRDVHPQPIRHIQAGL